MPWLEQLGGMEPMEVQVPVPNLEVSLSDESLAGVEKRFATPVTGPSPEELIELSKGLLRVVIR